MKIIIECLTCFFRETYISKSYKFSGPTSPFVRYNSYE